MWFPKFCGGHLHTRHHSLTIYLLWLLTFSQLFTHSLGFFFPLFANFFNRLNKNNGNNQQNNFGGVNEGVSLFSGGNGGNRNATFIKVPMLRSIPQRRVDVVTTVTNNAAKDEPLQVDIRNVSTTAAAAALLSSKLIVPTSTSMTSSISISQQKPFISQRRQGSLTLPFTPNLFGMMSYVQALKDIKRNYHIHDKEIKIGFLQKEPADGDLMTRVLRTLIQKVVNKYQKQTEILKLKILKRQEKLQHFLQLPMVAQVITSDLAVAGQPVALGKDGALIGPTAAWAASGKRVPTILDSFLI